MEKTKSIYIYGASGHGLVVADIALALGYEDIIFLDDAKGVVFNANLPKFDIIIAVGDNQIRQNLQTKVLSAKFNLVSLLHPSAVISPSAKIGKGSVVMANVTLNAKACVGDGVILNSGCVIEHECKIGDFAHISPGANLAGGVRIGELTHVGIGANLIQCVAVGKNSVVGAGAVVIDDIPSNSIAVGVPAKFKKIKD
ncbi:MAG: acetyltransferase [Campylobacter sp.]|nr:acetyltransferase [Campylobacter sp.]